MADATVDRYQRLEQEDPCSHVTIYPETDPPYGTTGPSADAMLENETVSLLLELFRA